jgi:hypothetical protein
MDEAEHEQDIAIAPGLAEVNDVARRAYEICLDRFCAQARRAVEGTRGAVTEPDELAQERGRYELALERLGGEAESLPMQRLRGRFALSDDEAAFVWGAVAVVADPGVVPLVQALAGTEARRGLSLSVFAVVAGLDGARRRELACRLDAGHPLIAHRLLEPVEQGASRAAVPLAATDRLVRFLAGSAAPPSLSAAALAEGALEHDAAQAAAIDRLAEMLRGAGARLVLIEGAPGSGRRTAAGLAAAAAGRRIAAVGARDLPTDPAALAEALRGLRGDCALHDAVPLICDVDAALGADAARALRAAELARFVDEAGGIIVVTAGAGGIDLGARAPVLAVRWPVPDSETRYRLWASCLAEADAPPEPELRAGPALPPRPWAHAPRGRLGA